MALIVEDGTLVAGANSYASLALIKAFALARGVTLGPDDAIETMSTLAIDYLEGKRNEYQGNKIDASQELQFPRIGVIVDDFEIPYNSIPKAIVNAQCQLIIEQSLGINIMPTQTDAAIKSETIGPIKTDYAVNPGAIVEPHLTSVNMMLKPLFKKSGGFGLSVVRV